MTATKRSTSTAATQLQIRGHDQDTAPTYVPIIAMLLDMDGTLVDSAAAVERQWRTFLRWYDLPTHRMPAQLHGTRAEDHVRSLLPPKHVRAALLRFAELEQQDLADIAPIPGALELLQGLQSAHLPWAVVTSGSRPVVAARLDRAGLPTPRVLISADDVTAGKPDPQPYLLAAARFGLTQLPEPGLIVAVEDAPVGITSARAAGCTVIALTSTHHQDDLHEAARIVPDLRSLTLLESDGQTGLPQMMSTRPA